MSCLELIGNQLAMGMLPNFGLCHRVSKLMGVVNASAENISLHMREQVQHSTTKPATIVSWS